MERLSFISGSSANEDEEEDEEDEDLEEDPMAILLPPPPLPPKPPILMNQLPRGVPGGTVSGGGPLSHHADLKQREATPIIHATSPYTSGGPGNRTMYHYEDSEVGTVRRKAKRERNRTTSSALPASGLDKSKQEQISQQQVQPSSASSQPPIISEVVKGHRSSTSKSRSKSRSPGRTIEGPSGSASASAGSARSSRSLHASRGNSPDNISGKHCQFF